MRQMIPRILFDRSIFHKDGFTRLKASTLTSKLEARKAQVVYTPLFIEETLLFASINPSLFAAQWNYIVGINESKWFKFTNEILALELGNRAVGRKYYLRTKEDIARIVANVPAYTGGEIPSDQLSEASKEIEDNNLIRDKLRERVLQMRKKYPQQPFRYEDVVAQSTEWYIEQGLMKWHTNSAGYLNYWRNNRSKCRFTESHVRAALAVFFLPLANHQLKIDRNDKHDAEQLAFMKWGDIFVSDDTRFMKQAFDLLYASSGKQFMNSAQFLEFLHSL